MAARKRPTRNDADAGVKRCMELMADGLWVSGRSHDAVAGEFGVSPATVKDWATSASRVIRATVSTDSEELRARLVTTLETIVSKALVDKRKVGKRTVPVSPDLRNAVAAIAEQGRLLGLVTQNHKVDMTVRQYEQLEPVALRAKLLEQRARIDEALAKLDAEHPARVLAWGPPAFLERTPEQPSVLCGALREDGASCHLQPGHPGDHETWKAIS